MTFFKQKWLQILGVVTLCWAVLANLVLPLIKVVMSLLGIVGSLDVVISRYKDPDWIGVIINFLLNPPPGTVIGMFIF